MDSTDINKKCQSLDKSNRIFKDIIKNCNNPKFMNLDKWQRFQASSFKKENQNKKDRFMTYKRGTVVFINFGTSIGNELCGNHFGIVLSKNDSPSKGNLTVLPLTSKKKKYHLSLGNELIKNIFSDLFIQYKNFKKFTDTLHSSILDNDGHLKYIEGDKVEIKDEFIASYITNRIKRLPTDDGLIHYSSDEIAQLLKLIYREIDEIINFYKSKQTDSYGMIDSITTLSKYRIKKPLNYIDPIGRIRVSSETLEKVDIELIKKFTEFKINS